MTSFLIQNFGCRVNQAEAFGWAEEFQGRGLRLEKELTRSDLILVNSCTLTSRADRDVRQFIKKVVRINPRARLILTGCYVERSREEFGRIPQVWLIFSNGEKGSLASEVLARLGPGEKAQILPYRSRALLKVQDGCDYRCSFCIIPSVRGASVSLERAQVVARARTLVDRGYKEIVLSGIHLCSYGLDLGPESSLPELLRDLEKIDGLGLIRLSSLDPRFLKPEWLKCFTQSQKICQHFHLSLQHTSRRILDRMGRKIGQEDFRKILADFRQRSPEAALGADIIVGFPEETDEDFRAMAGFLEESPLTYFHVFPYSPRSGTAAAGFPQVNDKTKKERSDLLRKLSKKKNLEFRKSFLGRNCRGVVIKREKDRAEVLTSNYLKVIVPPTDTPAREIVQVLISRVDAGATTGEIIA